MTRPIRSTPLLQCRAGLVLAMVLASLTSAVGQTSTARRRARRLKKRRSWSSRRKPSRAAGRECIGRIPNCATCSRGTRAKPDWAETVVDDESLFAQWISMGPGQKTPRRMNGDTREWWIVQSGTLKFTVEGREPVIATKGLMVQVPYRTLYQIENVGNEAALRFEVNVARARKLYPLDETPTPLAGLRLRPDARDGRSRHARRSRTGPCSISTKSLPGRNAAGHSSATTAASRT